MNQHHTHKSPSKGNFVKSILPENWHEQSGANFSSDDLIDAYFKGKADGQNQIQKIILERFKENITTATKLAEKLISLAKEKDIKIINALLRIEDVAKFTILFVVSEEDYLSEKFRNIYLLSSELKNTNNTDSFSISFTFTNQSEHLNSECMASDGFIMKYGNTGKA